MDEEQMQAMEASAVPNSTSRATKHGVKKFDDWAAKRKIEVFFHAITAAELAAILRKFYAEVKQLNGKMLSPSSMTGIRAALNRFVNGSPFYRNFDLVAGTDFIAANKMFDARCKLYYKLGNKKPQHKPVIEEKDMAKLNTYFSSWDKNPVVLQEAVWFSLCYFFGRRGREGWAGLKKDTFEVERDPSGASYVTCYCTEAIKNVQGGHRQSDQDYSDNRMYGESVKIYQFYLSKLNPDCDRLFQLPLPSFNIGTKYFSGVWFGNRPIGKNTLSNMMQRISKRAELSKVYTCHCVRASTITTLFHAGVPAEQIIALTKHKNTGSLKHYIDGLSTKQKTECSSLLSMSLFGANKDESDPVRKDSPSSLSGQNQQQQQPVQSVNPLVLLSAQCEQEQQKQQQQRHQPAPIHPIPSSSQQQKQQSVPFYPISSPGQQQQQQSAPLPPFYPFQQMFYPPAWNFQTVPPNCQITINYGSEEVHAPKKRKMAFIDSDEDN